MSDASVAAPPRLLSGRGVGPVVALTVAALFGFVAAPRVRATPGLLWAVVGWGSVVALAALALWWRDRRAGRRLEIEVVIRTPHYVQLGMHAAVYVYWGLHWEQVGPQVPLIVAQVAFAYGCEMVLAWRRYGRWRIGFGPWPVVGSTNLFLWWHDPYFAAQFAMVALAYLSRDAITWRRGGGRVHVFNPSAFGLAIAAAVMVVFEVAHLTWGYRISLTLGRPPWCYEYIFAVGVVVMLLFRVTLVTAGAAGAMVAAGLVYHQLTGVYLYLDTAIPIAVFLGMNLLITDPASSPRAATGRLIFGALYGLSVFALYPLLGALGHPPTAGDPGLHVTFLDKLLPVPILNLCVRRIDALVDRLPTVRWPLAGARANVAHVALWALFFFAIRGELSAHPGRTPAFWEQACAEGRPRACTALVIAYERACESGIGEACHNLGVVLGDGAGEVAADRPRAVAGYDRGCELGFGAACAALGVMLVNGDGVAADPVVARAVFERGCALGDPRSCTGLGGELRAGLGGPVDVPAARALLRPLCAPAAPDACQELAIALAIEPDADRPAAARAAGIACAADRPLACNLLGGLLMTGELGPQDPVEAAKHFERACAGGVAQGCNHLADLIRTGEAGRHDPALAARMYDAACDDGDPTACEDGALMRYRGDGVPRDRIKALELLQKGCALGLPSACTRHHQVLRNP
ncbi:MAG: hypothetical protein R3F65_11075 [bacterium]|nr:SEL1-like repeat protein [Myxococcales bacterium]MCB9541153.1 SEL1-like repeat protein [Myxococcales bacterium]MCB9551712.1 SEL1-like repeat protein [Myxococcales bacterium]